MRKSSVITFTHKTSSRSTRLAVKITAKGEVIVTSPKFIPKFVINQFVNQHQSWIEAQLKKLQSTKRQKQENTVAIFGKNYHKKVAYLSGAPLGIQVVGTDLICNTPEALSTTVSWETKHEKQLERFLKNTASTYIVKRTEQLAETMKTSYKSIALKQQSTRWGSCSSLGNLNFNWRLVHASPEIIDYVIIHELAHRTHMDHSRNFWDLVAKYDPAYLSHRGWLKRHGHGLS